MNVVNTIKVAALLAPFVMGAAAVAQQVKTTDYSLCWRKDKSARIHEQVTYAKSETGDEYKTIGHHGPAVENQCMILRMYLNHSGAIDVYSKSSSDLVLRKYGWYPTPEETAAGAGIDDYLVGKTVGLGGVALWDDVAKQEVKLQANKGREVWVEPTKDGALLKMLHKGVMYKGVEVDILTTVSVAENSRYATVEAECVNGHEVIFFTGVNKHPGQEVYTTAQKKQGIISIWGQHPPTNLSPNPLPIGGGMVYCTKTFNVAAQTDVMVYVTTKKAVKKASWKVTSACAKEPNVNTMLKFTIDLAHEAGIKL